LPENIDALEVIVGMVSGNKENNGLYWQVKHYLRGNPKGFELLEEKVHSLGPKSAAKLR
jgi:hypothetical protein